MNQSITMLYTLNEHCNWNCWYCNQGHDKKYKVLDIVKYRIILQKFKNEITRHDIKVADYIFMGGELCLLPNLNDYFIDIAKYLAPIDNKFIIVTNFSCDIDKYISLFKILEKQNIKAELGISAHAEYIDNSKFIAKINLLDIPLSVDVVGEQPDLVNKLKENNIKYKEVKIAFDEVGFDKPKMCNYQGYTILPEATIVDDCSREEFDYLRFKIRKLSRECNLICPACIATHSHTINKEYI